MEILGLQLTLHWFWLVKVIFVTVWLFLGYKYFKTKRNVYGVLVLVFLVIAIFNPIKLKTNTQEINKMSNTRIELSKVLPDKIEDNSFEERKDIKGITKEDIDLEK